MIFNSIYFIAFHKWKMKFKIINFQVNVFNCYFTENIETSPF